MKKKINIAIISPSGAVDTAYIDGAAEVMRGWGFDVRVSEHAKGKFNRFSGTDEERIADIQNAINDDWCNVILCARGGYGLSRIIDKIDFTPLKKRFKLFVGFSDITAIHNALSKLGLKSLHAPMAKHIATEPDSPAVQQLRKILASPHHRITVSSYQHINDSPIQRFTAEGILTGGNLSILYALRGTPFDLDYKGKILFIEDVGERLYHIDRMVQNLRLGGVFNQISGLIVGQFTDTDEDTSYPDGAYGIVAEAVKDIDIPVAYNFPAGHISTNNMPLLMGAKYKLNVSDVSKIFTLEQIAD
ncbi:MAG: LD-carboxypeptidase [Paludibacteraceae bacterium]|nr:LD-carboxypeptidase [Paludibacteraceae bacterium]